MSRKNCLVSGVAVLATSLLFSAVPDGWTAHDLSSSALTISTGGKYYVTGSGNAIAVQDGVNCDIALDGVTISKPAGKSPLTIGDSATVRLCLYGSSVLTAVDGYSGIALGVDGASLTVSDGDGNLTATGGKAGCGICVLEGASFTLDAADAKVTATSGKKSTVTGVFTSSTSGAGLGSYGGFNSGTVTINAGTLVATGTEQSAGIGGGTSNADGSGDCGDVIVNGGTVTATGKSWGCGIGGGVPYAGIGGNMKNYTQTGGEVTVSGHNSPALGGATGGMALLSGSLEPHGGSVLGKISVSGGRLKAVQTSCAAPIVAPAIGGGGTRYTAQADKIRSESTSGGEIIISGGCVVATGIQIGIGSGGMTTHSPQATHNGRGTSIKITDGTVYVSTTGTGAALWAIGGPEHSDSIATNLTAVTVMGGYLEVRNGDIQVHPTNGEALGDRRVYPTRLYYGDKSPLYVSAGDGAPAYEYVSAFGLAAKPDSSWLGYGTKWLPRGTHKVFDGNGVEMSVDVSPAECEPVIYDISEIKTTRISSSTHNMVITGSWNVLESELKMDSYIAGVYQAGDMRVTLRDLTCVNSNCTINVGVNNTLTINLEGSNYIKSISREQKGTHPAIYVLANSGLVIEGDGFLDARASNYAAAIGSSTGNDCGSITINSGTIYAYSGMQGAGIGCGMYLDKAGTCGDVTINGGTVRAYGFTLNASGGLVSDSGWAAGIGGATGATAPGGGLKSYTQTGGDVEAYGNVAAGIGGGGAGWRYSNLHGGHCGPVKITGGRLVADSVTYNINGDGCVGAGIGGAGVRYRSTHSYTPGLMGGLESYEQTGGDVTIRGKYIGIGTGGNETEFSGYSVSNMNTTVKISGGTLTVEGGKYAIGGMEPEGAESISLKSVLITGGSVKLIGGVQVAPSNTLGQTVYPAPTYMRRIADGATPVDVSISVSENPAVTYAYSGSGHVDDSLLYFWLPNGRYSIGKTGGDMVDGVWYRHNGLKFIMR